MQDLILLHGALGCKDQLQPLEDVLENEYKVHRMNFPGHGGEPIEPFAFSITGFADALKEYVLTKNISNPSIFGYSMGGYVALYAAAHKLFPIHKIITLATKFAWSTEIAQKETGMLDPHVMRTKVPAFFSLLESRHAPLQVEQHLRLIAELMIGLGENNPLNPQSFAAIDEPCLLMLGDHDKMVSKDETIAAQQMLPNASFQLVADSPHPIEKVDPLLMAEYIRPFFKDN